MELDKDLQARQEAREKLRLAEAAAGELARLPQEKLDGIVEAVARAFAEQSGALAEMAVRETGFGNTEDKTRKNRFASEAVAAAIRGMRCVGLLEEKPGLWEIGVPVGVIAAIVPSTNPTSTVCYKALIALKSGNAIVFSPHPKAICATVAAAKLVAEAAQRAGAPKGAVGWLTVPGMQGCQELMHAPQTRLILATGGTGMVKAAYSSGKPAIGVGAGNGPAYIHPSADAGRALDCIRRSKTFDNGTVCASEQSIIVEASTEAAVVAEGKKRGFYFLSREEAAKVAKLLLRADGGMNPEIVGKSARHIGQMAGLNIPGDTAVLVAREDQAGPSVPYSREKLCPVLAMYVMESEEAVLEKVRQILCHEGAGHTFAIHARDEGVIRRFAEAVPVSRILVNVPAALGGIGAESALFPALTLGCGAVGGSASSDNIGPMHLVNLRRVAWAEGKPAPEGDPLLEELVERILERLGK